MIEIKKIKANLSNLIIEKLHKKWIFLVFFIHFIVFGFSQSVVLNTKLKKDLLGFPLLFDEDSIIQNLPTNWKLEDSIVNKDIRAEETTKRLFAYFHDDSWINIDRRHCSKGKELHFTYFFKNNFRARREFRKLSRSYKKHFAKVKYKKRTLPFGGFWTEKRFYLNRKDKVPFMSISCCPAFDMMRPTMSIDIYQDIDLNQIKTIERRPKF